MANVSLTLLFVTALLVVIGMHGCDAFLRLIPLQCPYWDGAKRCRHMGKPQCNATSCDDSKLCCTISCRGARCLSKDRVCPQVQQGVNCTAAQRRKQCTTRCKAGSSCCSNNCGGTSCLYEDKRGTCPAVPTGVFPCPLILDGTTCASDTNCAGDQKCCKTICQGDQCTTPDF